MLNRFLYLREVCVVVVEKGFQGQMVIWYQFCVDYFEFDLFISEYFIEQEVVDVKWCYEDFDKL